MMIVYKANGLFETITLVKKNNNKQTKQQQQNNTKYCLLMLCADALHT
jgi:hypothetical protein